MLQITATKRLLRPRDFEPVGTVGTTLGFFSRFALFRPVLDMDVCVRCHHCEKNCKASCIDIDAGTIDHSRCVACFDCVDSCPLGGLKYRFTWKRKASR